ncbi:hypothetical protein [Microseira wollei]|uniref:hypothetical protein n=1 Tax=Microseira wollei TaxID=467598 RepID=UPI001CFC6702|nr:hypothetical protein [Microseira wollei]
MPCPYGLVINSQVLDRCYQAEQTQLPIGYWGLADDITEDVHRHPNDCGIVR